MSIEITYYLDEYKQRMSLKCLECHTTTYKDNDASYEISDSSKELADKFIFEHAHCKHQLIVNFG